MLRNEEYDNKVDVYSFGVCLIEVITGAKPEDDEIPRTNDMVVDVEEAFKLAPMETPKSFKKLLQFCCDNDPSKRIPFTTIITSLEKIKLESRAEDGLRASVPVSRSEIMALEKLDYY